MRSRHTRLAQSRLFVDLDRSTNNLVMRAAEKLLKAVATALKEE